MKQVWKFLFNDMDTEPEVEMPEFATLLHFGMDPSGPGSRFAVWAEVEVPVVGTEVRKFILRGTGHPITWKGKEVRDDQRQFLGTTITGYYVFHLWEYEEEGFTQPWES